MLVILITGKMGSGKTTTAAKVAQKLKDRGFRAVPVKFADPLYKMHEAIRGVALEYNIPFEQKEGTLLQWLGTEWGRNTKGVNVWVNAAINKIQELQWNGIDVAIVEDCRFKNELAAFPNALKIRLECSEEIRKARCEGWRENTQHPSEIDLDDLPRTAFDYTYDSEHWGSESISDRVVAAALTLLPPGGDL